MGVEKREEMKRWFFAFGAGGRMCLGSNFAVQGVCSFLVLWLFDGMVVCLVGFLEANDDGVEMKLVVAAVYTTFRTEIVDGGGMEQADTFVAGPVGGKCVLRFSQA